MSADTIESSEISIIGAREKNLKDLSVQIPHRSVTAVCGVSGSGKSSLVRDVIYQDSIVRYRSQFLLEDDSAAAIRVSPDVICVAGSLPATYMASSIRPPASDLCTGEVLGLDSILTSIWRRFGEVFCPNCGREIKEWSIAEMVRDIQGRFAEGARLYLCSKYILEDETSIASLIKRGYARIIIEGDEQLLDELDVASIELPKEVQVVIDRIIVKEGSQSRIHDSLTVAAGLSGGQVTIFTKRDRELSREVQYLTGLQCGGCSYLMPALDQRFFARVAGGRRRVEVGAVKINGMALTDVSELSLEELGERIVPTLEGISEYESVLLQVRNVISASISLCKNLGISYLPFSRTVSALSEGELYLLRLAALLSADRVNTLYIFDEPSSPLAHSELELVTNQLSRLCKQGNTVLLVDHAARVLQSGDVIIELGPGAGKEGGRCVFQGGWEELSEGGETATASFARLNANLQMKLSVQKGSQSAEGELLKIIGATRNNLKDVEAIFPMNRFTCVSGVHGSGKTSLVFDTLLQLLQGKQPSECDCKSFEGDADSVVVSEWVSPPNNIRSCIATYVGIFDEIREVFSLLPESKVSGFGASSFSFNTGEEVCRECGGSGLLRGGDEFPMVGLPACRCCRGHRFDGAILYVRYRDKNIADVLGMEVVEGKEFFMNNRKLSERLLLLDEVGLGYLQLGQALVSLSHGEMQRLKLIRDIRPAESDAVFIIDQPSRGLHYADLPPLLRLIQKIVAAGNTVIAIERNPYLMKDADWLIEMGPSSGERGGEIVNQGVPRFS